ncbi:Scr1 family TA system antitoxin-like transcriptional regulator [Streptomyces cirratus]
MRPASRRHRSPISPAWAEATGFPEVLPELKNSLRRLETHYRSWRRQLAGGHKAVQDAALAEEQRAQVIRVYETSVIPGIFQTAEYARHLFTHSARLRRSPRDVEDAVRARLRRQEVLYQRGQKYRVIIWEAVLYAVIGEPRGHARPARPPRRDHRPGYRHPRGSPLLSLPGLHTQARVLDP